MVGGRHPVGQRRPSRLEVASTAELLGAIELGHLAVDFGDAPLLRRVQQVAAGKGWEEEPRGVD